MYVHPIIQSGARRNAYLSTGAFRKFEGKPKKDNMHLQPHMRKHRGFYLDLRIFILWLPALSSSIHIASINQSSHNLKIICHEYG